MNRFKFVGAAAAAALVLSSLSTAMAQESGDEDALFRDPAVTAPYERGLQLMQEGKYKEAMAAFNESLAADGTFAEAYIGKGDALKELQDFQAASAAYTQAQQFNPNSAAAYNGRGECQMELGQIDVARSDFLNAINLDPNHAAALSNLGHLMAVNFQAPTDALRYLDDALALNPQDARAYRDRGLAHALLQEFDESVTDLQEAVRVDPTDYENFSTLAQIYLYQDEFESAVDAWSKAIEAYQPKRPGELTRFVDGYIYRADARLRLAEKEQDAPKRTAVLEGAIGDANAVLALFDNRFPQSGRAYFRRGRAERMLERFSDGVNSLTLAIENVPPGQDIEYLSDAYLYRGICWYHIGSLDLARGDFEQASGIGNGFQDPRVFLWIGFTYHKQGDFRQAIDSYGESISKSQRFALAHVNKGRAYMDLGEYDRAIESFNRAIGAEPTVGEHYYNVGFACIQLEDFQKAVDFLNLALHQENPQPKFYRAMAAALRGLGREELADEYERQAESAAPAGVSD
jgi:tetratricopeptide (TPR) repeat protein